MIEKMTKYSWILLSGEKEAFLESLRSLGVVDIERSVKPVDDKSEAMMERISEIKKEIKAVREMKDDRLNALIAEEKELTAELDDVSVWGEYDREKLDATGIRIRFYRVTGKKFEDDWLGRYPLQIVEEKEGTVWFVVLGDVDFPLMETKAPSRSPGEVKAALESCRKEIEEHTRFLDLRKSEIPELEARLEGLQSDLSLYLASLKGQAEAENSLVVYEGFAPSSSEEDLKPAFDKLSCIWLSSEATVEDNPPIKLKNNAFVRMFEPLTDMYGRPAYNGFDPTPYLSVFFLLFFAMCMGDAGYGIILVIIGLLLKKAGSFRNLSSLVVTLGAGTVIVGLFFHTFFSMDMLAWNRIPESVRRLMLPTTVSGYDGTMILAIGVGIIHLCLAMIVKTVYATRNKGFLESLGTWGWTLFLVGSAVTGAVALAGVIDSNAARLAIIVLGTVSAAGIFLFNDIHRNPLLNIGSGLWETYNTATGILGDVLSYLRLYALGLAGSMLGFAFNDLAAMARGDGGIGWLFFVLIFIVGHSLNIAMAVLGAFVHPLRLNFLEFFKNSDYQGVGRKYNPIKNK